MCLYASRMLQVEYHGSRHVVAAQDDKNGKGAKPGKVDKKAERVSLFP